MLYIHNPAKLGETQRWRPEYSWGNELDLEEFAMRTILCVFTSLAILVPLPVNGQEDRLNCITYLSAEREYLNATGKKSVEFDHAYSILSNAPTGNFDDTVWSKYLSAYSEMSHTSRESNRASNESIRANARNDPDRRGYAAAASKTSDRFIEALKKLTPARKEWEAWLAANGADEATTKLIGAFIGEYGYTHKIYGHYPADIVLRVAVHERRTMCP